MEWLVGELDQIRQAIKVPHRGVQVGRLHRVAAGHVDDVEGLRQSYQVAVVFLCSGPAAVVLVGAVGSGCNLREGEIASADADIALGIARMQGERAGSVPHQVLYQPAIEPHPLGACSDIRTRGGKPVPRLLEHEVHPCLLKHGKRCLMDGFQSLLGQKKRWLLSVEDRAIAQCGRSLSALAPVSAASPARAPAPFRCSGRVLDRRCDNVLKLAHGSAPCAVSSDALPGSDGSAAGWSAKTLCRTLPFGKRIL
jgi:hypothetical protein